MGLPLLGVVPSAATDAATKGYIDTNFVGLTGNQSIAGIKTFSGEIVVPAPTAAGDAATKSYVDSVAQGLAVKGSCRLGTAAALPANAYLAGVLTGSSNGALTVDGTAVAANDRILVKDEAAQANNGIYTVTATGGVAAVYVLTRASDMDAGSEVPGAFAFVEAGSANAGMGYVVAGAGPYTLGTTAIVWTQFSGAGEITAGNGLSKAGNTLSLASTTGGGGLTYTAGVLAVGAGLGLTVNTDDVALASSAAGGGLTYTSGVLAVGAGLGMTVNADDVALASSVAGNGLTYTSGVLSLATASAGAGLTYTSGVLAVTAAAGAGITVNADDIAVDYGPDPWKKQVRAATVANGTLSTAYANTQVVDGVTLATGDRILLKNQTTGSENGIYTVNASGSPTRATDFDATAEAANGMFVYVREGSANTGSIWVMTNTSAPTIGTTALTFSNVATQRDHALISYSADRTLNGTDGTALIDASGASRTVTLPTAVGRTGETYTIKRTDSTTANTVTVATTSSQTIDGATTYTRLWAQYSYVQVVSDGSNWQIVDSSNIPGPWQAPSYNTNWSSSTTFNGLASLQVARYRFGSDNNVRIEGAFKAGGTLPGAAVFALPTAYRPITAQMFPCMRNNGGTLTSGMALVNTAGNVDLFSGSGMAIAINNEYFIDGQFPLD